MPPRDLHEAHPAGAGLRDHVRHVLDVVQRGAGGGLGHGVEAEGRPDTVERRDHAWVSQGVPRAQPGQAVGLGEGAQGHHVGVLVEQVARGVAQRVVGEVDVGLVDHQQSVRRHPEGKAAQARGIDGRTGRVVWVAEQDHPRL